MRLRTYLSVFMILSLIGVGLLYVHLNYAETMVPGIPESAIRHRILANSDHLEDQMVKRKVRDEVVQEINTWVKKPKTIQEARVAVKEHLVRFQEIADRTAVRYGHTYPIKVDFGKVPFPTKLYGNQVYAAGEYEALRITLGKGEGGNWWCVLFPPLCFVDMGSGDAIPKQASTEETQLNSISGQAYAAMKEEEVPEKIVIKEKQKVEKVVKVRFLLWDRLNALMR